MNRSIVHVVNRNGILGCAVNMVKAWCAAEKNNKLSIYMYGVSKMEFREGVSLKWADTSVKAYGTSDYVCSMSHITCNTCHVTTAPG